MQPRATKTRPKQFRRMEAIVFGKDGYGRSGAWLCCNTCNTRDFGVFAPQVNPVITTKHWKRLGWRVVLDGKQATCPSCQRPARHSLPPIPTSLAPPLERLEPDELPEALERKLGALEKGLRAGVQALRRKHARLAAQVRDAHLHEENVQVELAAIGAMVESFAADVVASLDILDAEVQRTHRFSGGRSAAHSDPNRARVLAAAAVSLAHRIRVELTAIGAMSDGLAGEVRSLLPGPTFAAGAVS